MASVSLLILISVSGCATEQLGGNYCDVAWLMSQPVEEQGRLPYTQQHIDMNNAVYLCLCKFPDRPECSEIRGMVDEVIRRDRGY